MMAIEIPEKKYHPCWHTWDEVLLPAKRMTDSLENLVPNIHQLRYSLEETIQYARELEDKLAWCYTLLKDHTLQRDEAALDEVRAILQERVGPPDFHLLTDYEEDDVSFGDDADDDSGR